ncbi:MAG: ribonuclease HII [Candidatus Levybacteria bacterium]|nr:ribonuclease HII [Candidatus Levybacteria bacterium]
MKVLPTFSYELDAWGKGWQAVAGLDEVGRGAFAGPVVTAAVIFSPHYKFKNSLLNSIDDSKRLSAQKREALADLIKQEALCYSTTEVSLCVINEVGIGKAAQKSFQNSAQDLCHAYDFLLTDAFPVEGIDRSIQIPIVHGDRLSISIAAASILAKVFRDREMATLHSKFPEYGFDTNMGYGTAYHRKQITQFGLSPAHRTSFNLQRYSKPAS